VCVYDVIGVEAMGGMLRCGRIQEEVDFAAELRQLAPGLSQAAARLDLESVVRCRCETVLPLGWATLCDAIAGLGVDKRLNAGTSGRRCLVMKARRR